MAIRETAETQLNELELLREEEQKKRERRSESVYYTTVSSTFVSISSMEFALTATTLSFSPLTRTAFSLIQNVLEQTASSSLRSGSTLTTYMSL